ncbi:MAG: hypothetical protein J1F71_01665 [Clostridiales bacterium]|nr:hypothetical protein [Clostridiales bacterium]
MKDKTARIIAIIALIFMAAFVVTLTLSLAGVMRNVFSYVAIGCAAVTLALFMVLKINGRGYSMTDINNEIEMEKIRKENEEKLAEEKTEQSDTYTTEEQVES